MPKRQSKPFFTLIIAVLCSWLAFVPASYAQDEDHIEVVNIDDIEVRYLHVQRGQTLHNIVRRLYAHRKAQWPRITKDIVRMNRHAFIDGDPTKMKSNVRLELPRRHTAPPPKILISKKVEESKIDRVDNRVGLVVDSRGQVLAVKSDKASRKLKEGDGVYIGDKIITGEDGYVRLHMVDDALLDLRCYSIMVIEEYQLKTGDNRSVINLLQGSLRKVTGEIGKFSQDVYELKTPVASLGVRGTEYALRVFQSKGCDGSINLDDEGLYLKVLNGVVDVDNGIGVRSVKRPDTLFIAAPGEEPKDREFGKDVLGFDEETFFWYYLMGLLLIAFAI